MRAVGAAVGRNPVSIIVPCHRVVGSYGALTGYAGGLDRKTSLLRSRPSASASARCAPAGAPLRPRDVVELVVLAALWGASFLFMRIAASEFGPVALAVVRVAGAALLLFPLLAVRGELGVAATPLAGIAVVGALNSALPFLCFSLRGAVDHGRPLGDLNSATPLFAALVAWRGWGQARHRCASPAS